MSTPGASQDRVGEEIKSLRRRFDSFPVNQTTLSLSERAYEETAERAAAGAADVYVRVRNDEGEVLHVGSDDRPRVPRCVGDCDASLVDRARRRVREQTGVECEIEGVARVTIAGVRNADDPDAPTIYRLLVLFEARRLAGSATGGVWQSEADTPEFV